MAVLRASLRRPAAGSVEIRPLTGEEIFAVTVIVRPRRSAPPLPTDEELYELGRTPLGERQHLSLGEYRARYGAAKRDLEAVERYARRSNLRCLGVSEPLRSVLLEGNAADLAAAFGATLAYYRDGDGNAYRARRGYLQVPDVLAEIIESVHGFDSRPVPRLRKPPKAATDPHSYSPWTIARLYDFPERYDGSGQRIAIVAAGGFRPEELAAYFRSIRRPLPKITPVSVQGTRNRPGRYKDFDTELMLDLQVLGAIVPGAELLVYLAPRPLNGMGGWIEAVRAAVFDRHELSVLSLSWGLPEAAWTTDELNRLEEALRAAALLGVTVCCASGDWGAKAGFEERQPYVNYPAASPFVLACGGTSMETFDGRRTYEEVWNESNGWASGGGLSRRFPVPSWQRKALEGVTSINARRRKGRGVPDVAGLAEAAYRIRVPGGYVEAHGGTSAVAPLWAGLVAQLNQRLGAGSAGYLNPLLYESVAPTGFHPIVDGTNGGYHARDGWDACTGLGSPIGGRLLRALTS